MEKYMRLGLLIVLTSLLFGCAQLMKGQLQPVNVLDAKQKIFHTTCTGAVEEWGTCFSKAKATCAQGYDVIAKEESAVNGRREITFQCRQQ
jgi:hypothetical protein